MSGDVLMTLGSLRFSVQESAFQRLSRKLEIRVGKQERANAQTARQILGFDETIEIEGVVFPDWAGGIGRLDDIRALAKKMGVQTLTDGLGKVWGQYIMEQVDEDATHHTAYGVPMRQAFRISLGAYG